MNFQQFLNEAPELIPDEPKSKLASKFKTAINSIKNKEPFDTIKHNGYGIKLYKIANDHGVFTNNSTAATVEKDDIVELILNYRIKTINGKKYYQNTYVQKGNIKSDEIVDIMFTLSKDLDGIVSDDTQSRGGKNLWEQVMKFANDKKYDIAVYNNKSDYIEETKDSKQNIDEWIKHVSENYYLDFSFMSRFNIIIMK